MSSQQVSVISAEQRGGFCFVHNGYRLNEVSGLATSKHGVATALPATWDDMADRLNVAEVDNSVASLQLLWLDGLENHCCMNCRQDGATSAQFRSALREISLTTELTSFATGVSSTAAAGRSGVIAKETQQW